jgi:hypothetical protein
MRWALFRLSDLLSSFGEDKVSAFLRTFRCSKDRDLEHFLHSSAVMFEGKSRCRTYLLVDAEDGNRIVAYVSLALTRITVGGGDSSLLSKSLVRRMDLSGGEGIAYLIGQLAKDDSVDGHIGHDLVQLAVDLLRQSHRQVGCRTICVDCKEPLLKFYRGESFVQVSKEPEGNGLYRMMCLF